MTLTSSKYAWNHKSLTFFLLLLFSSLLKLLDLRLLLPPQPLELCLRVILGGWWGGRHKENTLASNCTIMFPQILYVAWNLGTPPSSTVDPTGMQRRSLHRDTEWISKILKEEWPYYPCSDHKTYLLRIYALCPMLSAELCLCYNKYGTQNLLSC